ncbi:MFS transporter [Mangrovicella endophytica]|uniref:MFS transporter n=1 Tax=Mangrovicella endophytica TaxID=2066697 RepID=UPI000C9E850A|nr:MFS transporter [Mangrovicella endophytica]
MTETTISVRSRAPAGFPPMRLAVGAAFLANGFVVGSWAPQIPVMAQRLGLSSTAVGLMVFGLGVGSIIAMPLVGAAIMRVGSRRPTMILQTLITIVLALVALAPNIVTAAIAVAIFGFVVGGMDVAMNANAVSVERRMPTAIMSSCHGFWSIGGLLGAGLGGPIIAAVGAPLHALIVGVAMTILTIVSVPFLQEDRTDHGDSGSDTPEGATGAGTSFAPLLTAFGVGILALFAMIPEGAAIDWSALYLRRELGASTFASGFAFAACASSMAILRFVGDKVRDRFGAVRTARFASVIAAVGLGIIGMAPHYGVAIAGFAVMGIGLSNLVPIAFSAAGNVAGLKPGIGLSIVSAFAYSGILLAPSAIGFAAEHVSFAAIYSTLAGLLVIVFAGAGLLRDADRRTRL